MPSKAAADLVRSWAAPRDVILTLGAGDIEKMSKLLVAHAIEFVKSKQIPLLMLTSNPKRIAANKLYQTMGFERKETNVYRMKL